jgi:hypothetical protein
MAKIALRPLRLSASAGFDDVVGEVRALAAERAAIDPALIAAAARAWAPNTVRAFLSDIRLWDAWCRRSRVRANIGHGRDGRGLYSRLVGAGFG